MKHKKKAKHTGSNVSNDTAKRITETINNVQNTAPPAMRRELSPSKPNAILFQDWLLVVGE
jgi:hypothetical protein